MLRLIKKTFIRLLTSIISTSNHTKCVLLSNQKYMTQPTLIHLHTIDYYPFVVKLDKCIESCNTLNNLSNKVRVPNKT